MKFGTMVIDPPWPISMAGQIKGRQNRPRSLPYQSMSIAEIKSMRIPDLLEVGSHVYLWCTNKTLRDAYDVLDAWGLRFHQVLVLTKPSGIAPALGYIFGTEFCLLAFNGRPRKPFLKIGTLNHFSRPSVRGQHSSKPDYFYNMVTQMSPGPYADVFSRKKRDGWNIWGNEVESDFKILYRLDG